MQIFDRNSVSDLIIIYNPDNQRVVKGGRVVTSRAVERLIASLKQEAPYSIRWSSSLLSSGAVFFISFSVSYQVKDV